MQKQVIATAEGAFVAWFSERGLARLEFPDAGHESNHAGRKACATADRSVCVTLRGWMEVTARALGEAMAGKAPRELPPLDLSEGTAFQRSVWRALQGIEPGETRSYSGIAVAIGHGRAARAVGRACGQNPIPVLVPCHRVLAKNGSLGGFSGGLKWKRRLLEVERNAYCTKR